jgi:Fic family protein
MPIKFIPIFSITPQITRALLRIEAVKQAFVDLPINPAVLQVLRETAKLTTTHYSTQIEGNRLSQEEVVRVVQQSAHLPGRERDEREVKGYYAALDELEKLAARQVPITERIIQTFHALVMSDGRTQVKPSAYRDGQNVIRDSRTRQIVYMPPEAKDVSPLMKALVAWLDENQELPYPLKAGIAHYQFATIHPYYDGNGRTARLLTTLILHQGGYDLKGIYSLEEYYARHLPAYYEALDVGPSHNYYLGRAEADITQWLTFFCDGMAQAFENVRRRATEAASSGGTDTAAALRQLDVRQRKILDLFLEYELVTAKQIGAVFGFQPRTCSELCRKWVRAGFLVVVDPSRKARKYALAQKYRILLD